MEKPPPIECSVCVEAAPFDEETGAYDLDGWDLDGEWGATCAKCTAPAEDEPTGLEALAAVAGAKLESEPQPVGIEFSAKISSGPFGTGCVDWDPDYEGPHELPLPKDPEPDTWVQIPTKKEDE